MRPGRKEERKGEGGGVQESERRKRSSEARENLVILRTAASLMDSVCVRSVHECVSGRGGSAGKGCVYPICSLPLPCGRKNHWPAPSQIPKDTEAGRETGTGEEEEREREVGHRGWPRNLLVERECVCVCMCSLS